MGLEEELRVEYNTRSRRNNTIKFVLGDKNVSEMTLREYFAGVAMSGSSAIDGADDVNSIATWSVRMADALLVELEKPVKI